MCKILFSWNLHVNDASARSRQNDYSSHGMFSVAIVRYVSTFVALPESNDRSLKLDQAKLTSNAVTNMTKYGISWHQSSTKISAFFEKFN